MRQLIHPAVAAVLILLLLPSRAMAGGGGGNVVYDPTNHIENIAIAANTAATLAQTILLVKQGIENLEKYGNGEFQNLLPFLRELREVIERGNSLAYTLENLDETFQRQFPGYTPVEDYPAKYEEWTKTTLDTIRGTLNAINVQAEDLDEEQEFVATIQALSNTAIGRDQVLQAGNMIAAAQVKQMMKLRQLIMSQTNSQSVYLANQVNDEAQRKAKILELFSEGLEPVPSYEENADNGSSYRTRIVPRPHRF